MEKIIEYCMRGDHKMAHVWLMKLRSAGFNRSDYVDMTKMSCDELRRECEKILGL